MEIALDVKDLSYIFPDGAGVRGLSFQVMRNDVYFLYGSHGAGKTVTLQALIGTLLPQGGTIKLFGSPCYAEQKHRLGYLPQAPYWSGRMTQADMLRYFSLAFGVLDGKFEKVLGLNPSEKRPVCRLPLFVQKKLGLGLALLGKPDLILLDEPFSGLDAQESEQLLSILSFLNETNHTTLLFTGDRYDPGFRIATKYGVLMQGRQMAELTAAQLSETCKRCIKLRTPQLSRALPLLQHDFASYEVLADDLVRIFCPPASSSRLNALLVCAGIAVSELWVAGMEPQEYLSKLAGGDAADD